MGGAPSWRPGGGGAAGPYPFRVSSWSEIFPPFDVSIACGDVELRGLTPQDVPALLDVAVEGVVPEGGSYPFISDWALLPPVELRRNSAQFYFGSWANARPEKWELLMVVRKAGRVVGAQDLRTADFAVTRIVQTGSWLGRRHQGQGVGTLMRQLVCAFAFDHLGAVQCRTEAYLDNPASQRVSEKVGYERFDAIPVSRLGESVEEVRFRLTPERFVRPGLPISYRGVEGFRRFIGIGG